jgi:hypothetical protein
VDPAAASCLGVTGKISLLRVDGTLRELATGLPSLASAGGGRGPGEVVQRDGQMLATIGLASVKARAGLAAAPRMASLVALGDDLGVVTVAA